MDRIKSILKNKNLPSLLLALAGALFLSFYTGGALGSSAGGKQNAGGPFGGLVSLDNSSMKVPVNVLYDQDKYYVTGVPEQVEVSLSGPRSLVSAALSTKTINAVIDLTKLTPGNHKVKVTVRGFNNDLVSKTTPKAVTVNIGEKFSKTVGIMSSYNQDNIADGYLVKSFSISTKNVTVTGTKEVVNFVDHVVANLNNPSNTKATITQNVNLYAVDENGNKIDGVQISPSSVSANLVVEDGSKNNSSDDGNSQTETAIVPVVPVLTGGEASQFNVALSVNSISITGNRATIESITSVPVTIDLSGVSSSTTIAGYIAPISGVDKISPSSISATVTPLAKSASTSDVAG